MKMTFNYVMVLVKFNFDKENKEGIKLLQILIFASKYFKRFFNDLLQNKFFCFTVHISTILCYNDINLYETFIVGTRLGF